MSYPIVSSSVCMREFGGRGLSTTPTTHTTDTNTATALTGAGSAHTHLSVDQRQSAATLPSDPFTERKAFLSPAIT